MKKLCLLILGASSCFFTYSQGILFSESENWEEVLAIAKKENKVIFLDVYTKWCGPCKSMQKFVFPDQQVGKYYNDHFINVHFNAEKGDGMTISKFYKIRAYPTLLFIKPDGEVLLKHEGALDVEGLVKLGENVIIDLQSPKPLSQWHAEYQKSDKRDLEFLLKYINKRKKMGIYNNGSILEECLKLIPDDSLQNQKVRQLIGWNGVSFGGKGYELLMDWYKKEPCNFSLTGPYWRLHSLQDALIDSAVSENNIKQMRKVESVIGRMYKDSFVAERCIASRYLAYFMRLGDSLAFMQNSGNYLKKFILNMNVDSLQKEDSLRLQNALLERFNSTDKTKVKDLKEFENFISLFKTKYFETIGIPNDVFFISRFYVTSCKVGTHNPKILAEMIEWVRKATLFSKDEMVLQDSYKINNRLLEALKGVSG